MSLRAIMFPHCCTAALLVDFGESEVAHGGSAIQSSEYLTDQIKAQTSTYTAYGYAMLTATTNNEQKIANKVLLSLGFKHSAWLSKKSHQETKVRLWWLPLG